jgi:hypothetical protein
MTEPTDHRTALQRCEHLSRPSLPTPHASASERMVDVLVAGRVPIPKHALSEPLAVLQLTTEGYVRLQDYAEAVARTVGVLAKRGIVELPV